MLRLIKTIEGREADEMGVDDGIDVGGAANCPFLDARLLL